MRTQKTMIHERVEQARSGENLRVIARVPSGWVVMGDVQFLRGYCLLLPDPVVPSLNDLSLEDRSVFFSDLSLLGDAILSVTGAERINYEILCNVEPALHAHAFPRFVDEPEEFRKSPVWFYDWKAARPFDFPQDRKLMLEIGRDLEKRFVTLGLNIELAHSFQKGIS